jgi:outer membrane lipoprotein-sorting protein
VAAAAVVVMVVLLSTQLWDRSVPSAYAVEQTIEAMRSIESMHVYCRNWDGSEVEGWVEIDPETGHEQRYRAEDSNCLILGTGQTTYYYFKDKKLVRVRNKYMPASEVRFSRFFEDLVTLVRQYNGEIRFSSESDQGLGRDVILVWVAVPAQEGICETEFVVRVDSQTKLPISSAMTKGRSDGSGPVKNVDRIEYNVALPEGIFEFEIPDGAEVVYCD